jgi:threonylcarbamoyladenosine tRNA methylthiotransferase MtaB
VRYYLLSLGCKVNSYELDSLRESLSENGSEETFSPEDADLLVLNTCSVTATADQKSRQHIRKLRRAAPRAVLVVMGCYSELHAQETVVMGADIVIGTSERKKVLEYVDRFSHDHQPIVEVKASVRHEQYEELGPMALAGNVRAYLKIQDGCDNYCSYCLIPTLRGNSRSRDPKEVLFEARRLTEAGYKEIVIAGIHIGAYGKDLGDGSYRLSDLLRDVLNEVPELYRLRISSLEESEITPQLLSLFKERGNIASHFHIPLQSGSSSVLKRMRRRYDTESFLCTLGNIRSVRPEVAITTDVIVGFPGENEEEWAETMRFAALANFAEIHVFPFSPRNGTAAAALPSQVASLLKERRVHELLALSRTLRGEYEQRFFGQKLEVLLEDFDQKKGLVYGHTSNYLLLSAPSLVDRHGEVMAIDYDESSRAD